MENLSGEIQVLDGSIYNSRVKSGDLFMDNSSTTKAALLVYTYMEEWKPLEVPADVKSIADFENLFAAYKKQHGISADRPIPFLLDGRPASLDWHVIDWKKGMKQTHHNHKTSGASGSLADELVEILGFYSTEHKGVYTPLPRLPFPLCYMR